MLRSAGLGDDALHRRLLDMFLEQNQDFPAPFLAALAGGDMPTVARLAHTLKAVGGTLGAHGVERAAEALEAGCNSGAGAPLLEGLLDDVSDHLAPVLAGLWTLGR